MLPACCVPTAGDSPLGDTATIHRPPAAVTRVGASLVDDRHVVEVGPRALEGAFVDPVLSARPWIVDADLGVAHTAQHDVVLVQRVVDLRIVPRLPDAVPRQDPLVLDPHLDWVPVRDRLVNGAGRVTADR